MTINEIKYDIKVAFDRLDDSEYQELYNYYYTLDYAEEFLAEKIKPNLRGDLKERVELCTDAVKSYEKFMKHDLETRQCVIFKTYQGNSELAACLSLLQLIVRNGKLDLHASYKLPEIAGLDLTLNAHLFNALDEVYVQDATDNSKYNGYGDKLHLAHNAEVFLGTPRSFNLGLSVNF